MSYPKSPESVVEAQEQKSATPELHPTDAESDQPQDLLPLPIAPNLLLKHDRAGP